MNVEQHLSELSAADAAAFRAIAEQLRGIPERTPSASLESRILAAVAAEAARARRLRFRLWRWGIAAAAAAALIAVSLPCGPRLKAGAPADWLAADVDWLAANQEPDGTWSPAKHGGAEAYRPALTALAALALARDESGVYAPRVRRACEALAALQHPEGAFGGEGRTCLYNHALAMYALAALCSEQPTVRPALARALGYSRQCQTPEGGWDYVPGSEGNAAVTAWQVRALACAERQGFEEAKIPLRKGLRWLRGVARDDGSVAYHNGSTARSDGLTALAAHALLTAGRDYPGLPELGRHAVGSLKSGTGPRTADCYRDYAEVLAFASAGEDRRAEAVRRRMRTQRQTGQPDQWAAVGGQLYTYALNALAAK